MNFGKTIAALIIAAALQNPCAVNAADEDRELSLIAAEQENTGDEELDELNPALTETISTERREDTDKEKKDRRKKLRETRREKERENERKLRDSMQKKDAQMETESPIVIDPTTPEPIPQPEPTPEPVAEPEPIKKPAPQVKAPETQPVTKPAPEPVTKPAPEPVTKTAPEPVKEPEKKTVIEPSQFTEPITEENKIPKPAITPPVTETFTGPNPKEVYANFAEVARAIGFIPLYMPRKSGYEIIAIYAEPGIVEMQYGRRWEPEVGVAVRTYKRAEGEELRDISGVDGVKWRVDTTTGTTIYLAKISENEQVAAWAVGHYTFSAHSKNLSFAGFHALVADELVELSTYYYLDL